MVDTSKREADAVASKEKIEAAELQTKQADDKVVEERETAADVHIEAAKENEKAAEVHVEAAIEHMDAAKESKEYVAKKFQE